MVNSLVGDFLDVGLKEVKGELVTNRIGGHSTEGKCTVLFQYAGCRVYGEVQVPIWGKSC